MPRTSPPSPSRPRESSFHSKSMAETQRPPLLPPLSFLGHPRPQLPPPQIPPPPPPLVAPLAGDRNLVQPLASNQAPRHQPLPAIQLLPPHSAPLQRLQPTQPPPGRPHLAPPTQHQFPERRLASEPVPLFYHRPERSSPVRHENTISRFQPYQRSRHEEREVTRQIPQGSTPRYEVPTRPASAARDSGSHAERHRSYEAFEAPYSTGPAVPPVPVALTTAPILNSPADPSARQIMHLSYRLQIRQQPIAARACGYGERDRRVIDPPPILELRVVDSLNSRVDWEEMKYNLNVLHCTLWNEAGDAETAVVPDQRRPTRQLMGQVVSSPAVAKDENGVNGCFFCFPDLSCRQPGKYRLRFVLMRIDPFNMNVGGTNPLLANIMSDVFTVYAAKDFPGMRPSSALTKALKAQGCNIQVKKGNEKRAGKGKSPIDDDDDDGDEDGDDLSSKGKGKRIRNQ